MIPAAFPCIETERLHLRELVPADAPALFAIHGDAELMQWFGTDPLASEDDAGRLIELFASWRHMPNPGIRWGIEIKGQAALAGSCGLFAWNRAWHKCSIGYELQPPAHGHGYMQEALRAGLDWGFDAMQLNRVEAQVHPRNTASLHVLDRLGFRREGLLRQLGYWRGHFHDMYQYALLREEWERGEKTA